MAPLFIALKKVYVIIQIKIKQKFIKYMKNIFTIKVTIKIFQSNNKHIVLSMTFYPFYSLVYLQWLVKSSSVTDPTCHTTNLFINKPHDWSISF